MRRATPASTPQSLRRSAMHSRTPLQVRFRPSHAASGRWKGGVLTRCNSRELQQYANHLLRLRLLQLSQAGRMMSMFDRGCSLMVRCAMGPG